MLKKKEKTKKTDTKRKEKLISKDNEEKSPIAIGKIDKKKKGVFYYLNPKNFKQDFSKYGFGQSPKQAMMSYLSVAICIIALSFVFKLDFLCIIILALACLACLPSLIIITYKGLYEQARFNELNTYMEQFLYSFRKNPKIINTLNDVLTLFPDGTMHNAIIEAINHIMYGEMSENIMKESLEIIETIYPCNRLKTIHNFAIKTELNGGSIEESIDLLLNDRDLWATRIAEGQKQKRTAKKIVLVSILVSLGVAASILYFPNMPLKINDNIVFKISSIIILVLDLLMYLKLDKKININLLKDEEEDDEEIAVKDYERLKNYDEVTEKKKGYKYCILPVIAFLGCIIFGHYLISGICFVIILITLNSYKIGHNLRMKSVAKEIEKKFPEWLMEISLLTQYNNVMVSLSLSLNNAPAIIKPDLEQFLDEVKAEPNSIKPYMNFLSMFSMPEIKSAMRMLYSISNGTGGDVAEQTKGLIDRNNKLVDKAERIKLEEQIAGINALMYLPSMLACFKLLVDMTILMIGFMNMM